MGTANSETVEEISAIYSGSVVTSGIRIAFPVRITLPTTPRVTDRSGVNGTSPKYALKRITSPSTR